MLEARQLAAQRGHATLFADVDFALNGGEALIVSGPNGSGKTTLLRIVAGLTHAAHGAIKWRGNPVAPFDPGLREATLYIGHSSALKNEFSAEENLVALASLSAASPSDRAAVREALAAWSLDSQRMLFARVLSQGQRRRVALARLNLARRPLWVLDEPVTALDAAGVAQFESVVASHLSNGGIAVIATHQDLAIDSGRKRALRLS